MKCRAMSRQLMQVQNGATDTTVMDVHHESDSLKNKDKRSEGTGGQHCIDMSGSLLKLEQF